MNRTTNLLAILAALLQVACSSPSMIGKDEETSHISITCPATMQVKIPYSAVMFDTSAFPYPQITSECDEGGYSYTGTNTVLQAGPNTFTYTATNACGDESSCTFQVVAEVDFRAKFVGIYHGYRDCGAANQPQNHPDQAMDFIVDYGNKPNYLLVGSDQVEVDSNGTSLNPTLGSYRTYGVGFNGDSIYVYQQWGTINTHETCQFRGKKQ